MPEIVIRNFSEEDSLEELKEIFFESSVKKEFKHEKEKLDFYYKYLGYYLEHYPDHVFIAKKERILGYCLGSVVIDESLNKLQPHLQIFFQYFREYPAHLHINCHRDARGQGIGRNLLKSFESHLQALNITGVHIITSPDAQNRFFYERAGYSFQSQNQQMLFMGKKL